MAAQWGAQMSNIGDGLDPIEQDASFAQVQARQVEAQQVAVALPATGFVGSINGLSGLLNFAEGANIQITNDGVATITFAVTGLNATATVLNHVDVLPPNAGNDSTQGFATWSMWIDSLTPAIFQCVSAAPGAAVWLQISN